MAVIHTDTYKIKKQMSNWEKYWLLPLITKPNNKTQQKWAKSINW